MGNTAKEMDEIVNDILRIKELVYEGVDDKLLTFLLEGVVTKLIHVNGELSEFNTQLNILETNLRKLL